MDRPDRHATAVGPANPSDSVADPRSGPSTSQHHPQISTTPPTSPRTPGPQTAPSVGRITGSTHSVANTAPVPPGSNLLLSTQSTNANPMAPTAEKAEDRNVGRVAASTHSVANTAPVPPGLNFPSSAQSTNANPMTSMSEKAEDRNVLSGFGPYGLRRDGIHSLNDPLPPLPQARLGETERRRQRTLDRQNSAIARRSAVDWIVPVEPEKPTRKKTVAERIQPTLDIAKAERNKYATKARWTGLTLNIAIGVQVILGSLTTGLSAAGTTGRQTAIQTTILGGLATLVASYLARARGSNEPELSISRVKDLEHFIREVEAFQMDYGHSDGNDHDQELVRFRQFFEELLGNASGERKMAPPV